MNTSLLAFEVYFSIKQRAPIIFSLLALVYGFLINTDEIGEGMEQIALNSPYRIAYFLTLTSVLMSLVVALLTINTFLKDKEYKFDAIIVALSSKNLFVSRVLSVLINATLISFCLVVGMIVALVFGDLDANRVQVIQLADFLWPWLIIMLPNLLLLSATLIWATIKWQNAKMTYVISVLFVIVFWLSALAINAPITEPTTLAVSSWTQLFSLFEPFASSAFFEQTQFWTITDKNQRLISLSGDLLINRIIISACAAALMFHVVRSRSQLAFQSVSNSPRNKTAQCEPTKAVLKPTSLSIDCDSVGTKLKTYFQIFAFENYLLIDSWPIRVLMMIWSFLVVVGIMMVADGFGGNEFSGKYATTDYLLSHAGEAFGVFAQALMVFVIAESIWQERELKMALLSYTTPVNSTVIYFAKLTSVLMLPVIMLVIMIALCLSYQFVIEYTPIDYFHYASSAYHFVFPTILQAILLFLLQTLIAQKTTANKYLAMIVSGGALVILTKFLNSMGIYSPLLQVNQFPDLTRGYSELAGYGGVSSLFDTLAVYWAIFAIILTLITLGFWLSEERTKAQNSNRLIIKLPLAISIMTFVGYGLAMKLNMPQTSDFDSPHSKLSLQAHYEKEYKQYQDLTIPQFDSSSLEVDFSPQMRRVQIRASNTIINTSQSALNQIMITAKKRLETIVVEGGTLQHQESNNAWHVYLFSLERPIAPGEKRRFDYSLQMRSETFAIDKGLVKNGSYIHQGSFEPLLGYAEFMEIDDNRLRKQFGLAKREQTEDKNSHKYNTGYGKFVNQKRHFKATLSTHKSQVAITSGKLINQWQQGDRAYFQYQMDKTIYPVVGYFSANYKIKRFTTKGIPVSFYYHENHQNNIGEMVKATRVTLGYMQRHYGTYPYSSLRLIEVPKYHPFGGRASAGVVAMNESLFLQDYQDGAAVNNVARNTIHEIVHQWFGELLVPKITLGEKVLNESITKAIEATILGEIYGQTMLDSLMAYNKRRYQSGRSFAQRPEVPLMQADQQAYLSYGKGPLVFHAVKAHLGKEKYHHVLRLFIEKHQHGMTATLFDLVEMFKQQAKQPELIERWFADHGVNIEYLNLGGGLGIDYQHPNLKCGGLWGSDDL